MVNRPKAWLAALLGFLVPPFGLLYVGRWGWAVAAVVVLFTLVALQFALGETLEWLALLVQFAFVCTGSRIAYLQAIRFDAQRPRPGYSRWYGLWAIFLMFVGLMLGFRAFCYEPFRVPSGSMLPTLKVGSRLLVQKWGYGNYGAFGVRLMHKPVSEPIERGDVLVIEFPRNRNTMFIERIIGLPGDKIEYRSKVLFINGQEIVRSPLADYLDEHSMRYHSQYAEKLDRTEYAILIDKDRPAFIPGPDRFPHFENCTYDPAGVTCVVPDGHYYAMGDQRDNSLDSRYWGFVPRDHVVGKLVHVFSSKP